MTSRSSLFLRAGLVLAGCYVSALAQDEVVVTAEGEGLTPEAALRDAMRRALERGGLNEIFSESKVENFELIRDTILAKAEGIIKHHDVLEQGPGAGETFVCKIKAVVSKSALTSEWGAVQKLLRQIGKPGIMVFIVERIDGEPQDSSIMESEIENRLLKAGFKLYDRDQLDAIKEKEAADAVLENNVAKLQALAKNFHTQIFITGTADANKAGQQILQGQSVAMYNASGEIKMFYTDTAELIASEPLADCRGGVRANQSLAQQGGKRALQNCAAELAERCYQNAMSRWAIQITAGGEIVLEVEGVTGADAHMLQKKLEALDPDRIGPVARSFSKGIATYRITAKMTGADFAAYLYSGDWPSLIEVVDEQPNRIQAKWKGKP